MRIGLKASLLAAVFFVAADGFAQTSCGEASCVSAQAAYISHFTGADCTGTESYYLPYHSYAYSCRTWDGGGECGTIRRALTKRSYIYNGVCYNAWPSGNTLIDLVKIYRPAPQPPCKEPSCVSAQATYISHFTGSNCTGTESYYLPYHGYGYKCRPWNGTGVCGTIRRSVTNRSYRHNGACYNAWPSGNTLSDFVTVYRLVSPQPPVACGYLSPSSGTAPLGVWLNGTCSHDPDGGSITSYQWSTGEGNALGSSSYYTYFYPGSYAVWLTVWDDEGQSSSSFIGSVWVY